MKRLATLVLAASFGLGSLLALGQGVSATPFSDVPANHWAYQAIQSLAADGLVEGYPDGKFKGDRPLTRYEMAVLVARVIAKLQANGAGYASKADLDKLQKLIDALKDELDSLGVRVTNLEDALDALDKRTKFAQSIQFHGTILDNNSYRQRYGVPQTIAHGAADPFVSVFLTAPDSNSPLEQAGPGNLVRFDDKLNFTYTINENLSVSLPIHIINYEYGGEFTPQAKYSIQPDVVVNLARSGAFTNVQLRDGQLDNLKSSRVGLTYRAPDATQQGPGYENPVQPYEKGFEIGGVLNGLTEFQFSWTRLDQSYINTLTNVADPTGEFAQNNYFFIVTRPQTSYVQPGAPNSSAGAQKTDVYTASNGPLTSVYLSRKAQVGTVYISAVNGTICTSAALTPAGGACPVAGGGWYFLDNTNQVVFTTPLPVGTTVAITYVGLTYTNNDQYQRYHANARINQKFKGLPGAELGVSFSRIFDFADVSNSQGTNFYQSAPNSNAAGNGYGVVSDTVFGVDAQVPLAFIHIGRDRTNSPVLFGEGAYSKYTPDFYNTPAVTDSGAVVGLRLKIAKATATLQYQAVGANFMSGAPLRYFGPAPSTFGFWRGNYFPGFFGFANNLAINQIFDGAVGTTTRTAVANTYIYPVFNPFVASGPSYFSAFAPNTQGLHPQPDRAGPDRPDHGQRARAGAAPHRDDAQRLRPAGVRPGLRERHQAQARQVRGRRAVRRARVRPAGRAQPERVARAPQPQRQDRLRLPAVQHRHPGPRPRRASGQQRLPLGRGDAGAVLPELHRHVPHHVRRGRDAAGHQGRGLRDRLQHPEVPRLVRHDAGPEHLRAQGRVLGDGHLQHPQDDQLRVGALPQPEVHRQRDPVVQLQPEPRRPELHGPLLAELRRSQGRRKSPGPRGLGLLSL